MPRRPGWRREGRRRSFRYLDESGRRIRDPEIVERLDALAIPPAWTDVWIAPSARAKVQATGIDAAGRKQYRYHDAFRARQEEAKYEKLIRFAERLPDFRAAIDEHMSLDPLDELRVCAVAARVINLAWFRIGNERHTRRSHTYGVMTLRKSHVTVSGNRIRFRFPTKGRARVRTALVDEELADSLRALVRTPGPRLFRYESEGELRNLNDRRLNEYVKEFMGEEFSCKDFRTWGGTLTAAIALAERGPAVGDGGEADSRGGDAPGRRAAGEHAGGCARLLRVARGRRAVSRRPNDRRFSPGQFTGRLGAEYRPRSGGARDAFAAPILADTHQPQGRVELPRRFRVRRRNSWPGRRCSFATTAALKWTRARVQFCG
jgi:DNA topoisomerase IB